MTDYSKEMTISDEILKRVSESYRRIRNTSKFLLSNISDFENESLSVKDMILLDKWIIHKAGKLNIQIKKTMKILNFIKLLKISSIFVHLN